MGKVTIHIAGYGTVVVKRPRKLTKANFADALGEAVAGTCEVIIPSGTQAFHPVLGVGGFNWDHETQRAIVREARSPRVAVEPGYFGSLRVRMREVWRGVLGSGKGLRGESD